MKMSARIAAIVSTLALALMLLVGCGAEAQSSDTGDQSLPESSSVSPSRTKIGKRTKADGSGDQPGTRVISTGLDVSDSNTGGTAIRLVQDGEAAFLIVRPNSASNDQIELATYLRSEMDERLGVTHALKNDSVKKDKGDYEILLGRCNRPESDKVYKELCGRKNNAADFIIRMVGKKLVIMAENDNALETAVDYFLSHYCKNSASFISSELNAVNRPSFKAMSIAGTDIGQFTICIEKYPSYIVKLAAEELQEFIAEETGYRLKLVQRPSTAAVSAHEIQIGPQNGSVKATFDGSGRLSGYAGDGLLKIDYNAYQTKISGGKLSVNGGSTYAVDGGVQTLMGALQKTRNLPATYTNSGKYSKGAYELTGEQYALTYEDNFDYTTEAQVRSHWYISKDTTESFDGSPQIRNGEYGNDYYCKNGMLYEITRKNALGAGYNAVRLTTQDKMNFKYGYLEVRMVMATRNGACSAVWMAGDKLGQNYMEEIDINENFAIDGYWPNLHCWPDPSTEVGQAGHLVFLKERENEGPAVKPKSGEHFYDTFHYLGMDWTSTYIDFMLDGDVTRHVGTSKSEMQTLATNSIFYAKAGRPDPKLYVNTFNQPTVLKLANGVSTRVTIQPNGSRVGYGIKNPDEYLAEQGKTVADFYEVQLVDYVRIFQKRSNNSTMSIK